jgi:hypothetical protein
MPGRYVVVYPFERDPADPGLDEVLGMDARMQAECHGYHPTDDDAAVVWMKDLLTKRYMARVVVLVEEETEL